MLEKSFGMKPMCRPLKPMAARRRRTRDGQEKECLPRAHAPLQHPYGKQKAKRQFTKIQSKFLAFFLHRADEANWQSGSLLRDGRCRGPLADCAHHHNHGATAVQLIEQRELRCCRRRLARQGGAEQKWWRRRGHLCLRVPLAARLVPISGSSSRCPGLRSTGEFAARTAIESKCRGCSPLHQIQNKTPNLLRKVPSSCPCCPLRSDGIMDFCSPTTTFQISQKVGCGC